MCSKGVIDIGGHCKYLEEVTLLASYTMSTLILLTCCCLYCHTIVIYDAYIPLASMAFYIIYWAVAGSQKQKTL